MCLVTRIHLKHRFCYYSEGCWGQELKFKNKVSESVYQSVTLSTISRYVKRFLSTQLLPYFSTNFIVLGVTKFVSYSSM